MSTVTDHLTQVTMWNQSDPPWVGAVDLSYDSVDPYAIGITVRAPGDAPVPWVCARDLFLDALHTGSAGVGDVRIVLVTRWVVVRLSSPYGTAYMKLPRTSVASFLGSTTKVVPRGAEFHHHGDTEAELAAILAGGRS